MQHFYSNVTSNAASSVTEAQLCASVESVAVVASVVVPAVMAVATPEPDHGKKVTVAIAAVGFATSSANLNTPERDASIHSATAAMQEAK